MRTFSSWVLGVSVLLAAPVAFAQTDLERATARDAANNGRAAYDAGKYDKAIDYLSRAEQLVHSPTHLLYLARSQTKLGKLVAAHETYLKISRETLASNAPKAFLSAQATAEQEQDALDARLPSVTVTLQGVKATDVTVLMDGTALPSAMIGIPLPADPGSHEFKAMATNAASDPVTVQLAESAKQSVTLTLKVAKGAKAAAPAAQVTAGPSSAATSASPPAATGADAAQSDAAPPASQHSKSAALTVASIVSFSVGAVGLGLGSFFLLESSNTRNEANKIDDECKVLSLGGKCSNPIKQDQILSKDNDADSQRKLGIVSMIGGGVGVVAGLAFLIADISSGSPSARHTTPHVTPVFGFQSVGVVGTF